MADPSARSPGPRDTVVSFVGRLLRGVLGNLVVDQPPRLEILECPDLFAVGTRFEIVDNEVRYIVGRSRSSAHLALKDDLISRTHIVVRRTGRTVHLSDANSTNGVLLNGTRLSSFESRQLKDGDEIRIGGSILRFVDDRALPLQTATDLFSTRTRLRLRSPRDFGAAAPKDPPR